MEIPLSKLRSMCYWIEKELDPPNRREALEVAVRVLEDYAISKELGDAHLKELHRQMYIRMMG